MPFNQPKIRRLITAAIAITTATAVLGLTGCANTDHSNMPGMGTGSSAAPSTDSSTNASTGPTTAATPANGPHNDADVMFATMMIPHHQQAIEMSDKILAKDGINIEVVALARQIKAAQGPEITQMSGWLAGWGENPSPKSMDHDMGGGMDGTMTQAEMDALDKATGADAAKLFLTGMVKHHQGAVTMAEKELADGQNPDAKTLAQQIIDAQNAEITKMNELLKQL